MPSLNLDPLSSGDRWISIEKPKIPRRNFKSNIAMDLKFLLGIFGFSMDIQQSPELGGLD